MPWLVDYPREQVNWFPTLDPEKCVQCGMCMNCGRGVYAWGQDGPVVAHPYQCIVGCSTCGNLCLGRAISFPDPAGVRELYKKEKLYAKVKQALVAEGKIPAPRQA